jgi:hypothetical protein
LSSILFTFLHDKFVLNSQLKGLAFVQKQGLLNVDYESEVEDDILPIFRKGEVGSNILSNLKSRSSASKYFHMISGIPSNF